MATGMRDCSAPHLPLTPRRYLPANFSIPRHKLNELALPVDANQAHIFLHSRDVQDATSGSCIMHASYGVQ